MRLVHAIRGLRGRLPGSRRRGPGVEAHYNVSDMTPPSRLMRQVSDAFLAHSALVVGDVHLAPGVNLWFNVVIRGDLARITLGPRVNLQDGVVVHTDFDVPCDIAEGVVAGHGAILHGRRIGAGSLIGMGAVVLSGSDIGPECLIAAGCVVTENMVVPPRSLVAG